MENIMRHLSTDPILMQLIERYGFPEKPFRDGSVYESLLRAIVGQQLSAKAAATIHSRFLHLYGGQCPKPFALLDTPLETLRSAGLSAQKSTYLREAALWFKHNPDVDFVAMPDEEVIRLLTEIKGVGRWTAQMVLMFTLGRPDVMPVDDLGIRNAMARHYNLDEQGSALARRMEMIAEAWRPFRSWACFVLWKSLDA